MRVPLEWLGEFVTLEPDLSPEQAHAHLVRVGFEEEAVHGGDVTGPVVVGQVLSVQPEEQSNGKTINWCQVQVAPEGQRAADGGEAVRGIVCGAHNFSAGDKVVVTLPGAVLPGGFEIAARKTYGHVSDGMIASARELGLGDDHDGILRLAELGLDPEVGDDGRALLGLDQTAIEINVTPDRGYAFSMRGVAREYALATGESFNDPGDRPDIPTPSGFSVAIQDERPIRNRPGASVFVTRLVRGVDPSRPTPQWMAMRLNLAGIRSLSLVVDITNYVMLELGNPIHAYDFDTLSGGIVVRRAESGEPLTTLDGRKRTLHAEDLVIADGSGAIGLAGVMGGATTEISNSTTNVLVEAAVFDPVSIARTARRHKLPSEASRRFERGVDPQISRVAAQRVVDLLVELAGGTADELGSEFSDPAPAVELSLQKTAPAALIGVDYSADEIVGALRAVGATVQDAGDAWLVTPPSWRPDLTYTAALIEEVARVVGYERIPSLVPVAPPGRGFTREQRLRRLAANTLASGGFVEVQSYPFVSHDDNVRFAGPVEDPDVRDVRIANPLDGEVPVLRRSLIPGLLVVAQRNHARGLTDLTLSEIGSVFIPLADRELGTETVPPLAELPSDDVLAELNASLPHQPRHVALLLTGDFLRKQPGEAARSADWADALDAVRALAHALAVDLEVAQGAHQSFHPGRTAELFAQVGDGRVSLGFAGELHPALVAAAHLPDRVAAAELNLDAFIAASRRETHYKPISSFPAATQDLSLVVDEAVPVGEVRALLQSSCGELLEAVTLVDDYRGAGLPEGSRSLTFALRFRAADRTLTAQEANDAKMMGVAAAADVFGATIRE